MLSEKKKSEGYVEYGHTHKKVKNRKVNSMLFKDACMCVNIKMKANI